MLENNQGENLNMVQRWLGNRWIAQQDKSTQKIKKEANKLKEKLIVYKTEQKGTVNQLAKKQAETTFKNYKKAHEKLGKSFELLKKAEHIKALFTEKKSEIKTAAYNNMLSTMQEALAQLKKQIETHEKQINECLK